jgi:hypothetical protein
MPHAITGNPAPTGTVPSVDHSRLLQLLGSAVAAARALVRGAGVRVASITPDRWFLFGMILLFVAFLVVLMVQPSSVGRGGR